MENIFSIDRFLFPVSVLIATAGWCYLALMTLRRHLHWLQLEDYSPRRMFGFAARRWLSIIFLPGLIPAILAWLASRRFSLDPTNFNLLEPASIALFGMIAAIEAERLRRLEKGAKKKLNLTPRAKRILVAALALMFISAHILLALIFPREMFSVGFIFTRYLATIATGVWLTLAVWTLAPFENASQRRYIKDAARILGEVHPMVIGVTGSYGKTSVKEILAAMLADRYNLYRPPGSYNTLMGVTRAIREGLRPYHEAFVVEMGAYREGSIRRVCELARPTHGIVTAVGVQHLERFGSQAVIQRAKGELVKALPPEGVAVLNGDDPFCREMAGWRSGETIYFGVEQAPGGRPVPPMFASERLAPADVTKPSSGGASERGDLPVDEKRVTARNIRVGLDGSDFDLVFHDGDALSVHLSLLGRAAVANACAAAAMAERLGVSRNGISRALATIPHVRHRLEPKSGDGGVTVIDDAFNSNPTGAATALEVLASATAGRRVLVTPGMIELGGLEIEANLRFGRQAAHACDLAILVGVNRIEPIRQGLLEEGFPAESIRVVPQLTDGLAYLQTYLKPGDVMLLENDLPDQYAGM